MDKADKNFQLLLNELKKFNRDQLLLCISRITFYQSINSSTKIQTTNHPWWCIFLYRIIIYEWNSLKGHKPLLQQDLTNIINLNINFNNSCSFLNKDEIKDLNNDKELNSIMRVLFFHQFERLRVTTDHDIKRNYEIFKNRSFFEEITIKEFNLSLDEYIHYYKMIGYFSKTINKIKIDPTYLCSSIFPNRHNAKKFLNNLSTNKYSFDKINNQYPIKNINTEVKNDFIYNKPLLRIGNSYHIIDTKILCYVSRYGVYNSLKNIAIKNNTIGEFGDKWGSAFESYIENLFLDKKWAYVTESDLKKQKYRKQVDYILQNEKNRILIEAKGIEPHKSTRFIVNPDDMLNIYTGNIVKAINQINTICRDKNDLDPSHTFGIILTYKDLYLGTFKSSWISFIQEAYTKTYPNDQIVFNPENIFLIDIKSFEELLDKNQSITDLIESLLIIKQMSLNTISERFLFHHYIEDIVAFHKKDNFTILKSIINNIKCHFKS